MTTWNVDALVVGAGLAGLTTLRALHSRLGFTAVAVERGAGIGGVWYWNSYPGARCDSADDAYTIPFDAEHWHAWQPQREAWRYPTQGALQRYLEHYVEHYNLRQHIHLNVEVTALQWSEARGKWRATCSDGSTYEARYVVLAVGALSHPYTPPIPGANTTRVQQIHAGKWATEGADLRGKRVAVLGTGSTGIQLVTALAPVVDKLHVLQRTAHYTLPAEQGVRFGAEAPLTTKELQHMWLTMRRSASGFYQYGTEPLLCYDDAVGGDAILEEAVRYRDGFYPAYGVFTDALSNARANRALARAIYRDARKRLMTYTDLPYAAQGAVGAARIVLEDGYYEAYRRSNVQLHNIALNPIRGFTHTGIDLDGSVWLQLDALIYATGFDAITGSIENIDITTTCGESLRELWRDGASSYLGVMTHGMPNLFLINGPGSPSVIGNAPTHIAQQLDLILAVLLNGIRTKGIMRCNEMAEAAWMAHVYSVAESSVISMHAEDAQSWYTGHNIPGKRHGVLPWLGGAGRFDQICKQRLNAVDVVGRRYMYGFERGQ